MQSAPRLKLRADDSEDLAIVSAQLQDAIVPISDMTYLAPQKRFVMVANRFMWEVGAADDHKVSSEDGSEDIGPVFLRCNCGIRFEGVTGVRSTGLDLQDRGLMLELLAIRWVDGLMELDFSGEARLRLEMARPICMIEDIGEPWPTVRKPIHRFEDEAETS
jgi:hypothetical protein